LVCVGCPRFATISILRLAYLQFDFANFPRQSIMFKYRSQLAAFHELMLTGCLLVLAGCGGGANDTTSTSSSSSSVSSASVSSSSSSSLSSSSSSSAPAVPAVPAGVTATAGDTLVNLTWTASSGATSYKVKRGTANGGPYSQLATPTATSYSDTSLINGTTYYYVVTAVNSAGESTNSAQLTVVPTVAVSVAGLHVSGNKIQNAQNQPLALHGVNKAGTEYMCLSGGVFDGPSDAASVAVLQTWNINIVRLPINEDCWLGINGVPMGGTAYQTAIINYVNLLNSGNIAVIVDLQWAAPGTYVSNQLTPMPDADHAPSFWTSVANTFKNNGSVIFDLFNEPWPDNNSNTTAAWTCLRDGGTCPGVWYDAAGTHISYTAVGTQSLVNTIRATGSTNIIMVPGIQFANTLDKWQTYKPTDSAGQLAVSWHSYDIQGCNNSNCWTSIIQPLLATTPLITGEIGDTLSCGATYINPLMTFLDSHGGHYLGWAWNTYDCKGFPSLISDFNGTPTAFGLGFRSHLLGL
jgi:Cellulase (glycosyl hydrolase family 5)